MNNNTYTNEDSVTVVIIDDNNEVHVAREFEVFITDDLGRPRLQADVYAHVAGMIARLLAESSHPVSVAFHFFNA